MLSPHSNDTFTVDTLPGQARVPFRVAESAVIWVAGSVVTPSAAAVTVGAMVMGTNVGTRVDASRRTEVTDTSCRLPRMTLLIPVTPAFMVSFCT